MQTAWDRATIAALRHAQDYVGIQELPLIPGLPPVRIDLSGTTELITRNLIAEPLSGAIKELRAALAQRDDAPADAPDTDAEDTAAADLNAALPADEVETFLGISVISRALLRWHDEVLAVLVLDPYCKLADLPAHGRPDDQLCVFDFPPDVRGKISELLQGGVDALRSFRAESASTAPVSGEPAVRHDAEQPADPALAATPTVLAGHGDLRPGDGPVSLRDEREWQHFQDAYADAGPPGPAGAA